MSTAAVTYGTPTTPVARRARAYFAPVNRAAGVPTVFDPSVNGSFHLESPPLPWIDLGWISNFSRNSASRVGVLSLGSPSVAQVQMRESLGADLSFRFLTWRKITMALSAGSEHMNLLAPVAGGAANGSGSRGAAAMNLTSGSSETTLNIAPTDASAFHAGQMVVVDVDYSGQTGYVGSGVTAAYISNTASVNKDVDYVRRVSFNVALVSAVGTASLTLAQPLIAGVPTSGMRVQSIVGFVDREGGSFFQEWSALFVMPGEQGERIVYHYPRLQPTGGAAEESEVIVANLDSVGLRASFRALPVKDANDGAQVLCFRSFLPSPMTLI